MTYAKFTKEQIGRALIALEARIDELTEEEQKEFDAAGHKKLVFRNWWFRWVPAKLGELAFHQQMKYSFLLTKDKKPDLKVPREIFKMANRSADGCVMLSRADYEKFRGYLEKPNVEIID